MPSLQLFNLAGVHNVKDFGARGDGQSDDYGAFVAADTAANGAGTILVPAGTYKLGTDWSPSAGVAVLVLEGASFTGTGSFSAGSGVVVDLSAGSVNLHGNATDPVLQLTGAGNKSAAAYATAGTAWADGGTPAFVADQMYLRVNVGGTVYRIPLWADS